MQIKLDDDHTVTINQWLEQYPQLVDLCHDNFSNQPDYQHLNQLVANNKDLTIWERWMLYLIINCGSLIKIAFRKNNKLALYHLTDFLTFIVETPPKLTTPPTTAIGHKIDWFIDAYNNSINPDFITSSGQSNFRNSKLSQDTINELQSRPVGGQSQLEINQITRNLQHMVDYNYYDRQIYQDVLKQYKSYKPLFHNNREVTKPILNQQYQYLHRHTILMTNQDIQAYREAHQIVTEPDPYRYHDDMISLKQRIESWLTNLHPLDTDIKILKLHTHTEKPLNLDDIGKQFGLSRERIRQLENHTLRRLRYIIHSDKADSYDPEFDHHAYLTDERHFNSQDYLYGTWITH